jgi:hypothetical protein
MSGDSSWLRNGDHETGGARRTWLRGLEKINKPYQIHTSTRNLDPLMSALFRIGTPTVLQDGLEAAAAALSAAWIAQIAALWLLGRFDRFSESPSTSFVRQGVPPCGR